MLDRATYKLLKALYKKGELSVAEASKITGIDESAAIGTHASHLRAIQLISEVYEPCANDRTHDEKLVSFKITFAGRAYVEQRHRDLRNFWIPYAITTLIAILSLIVALKAKAPSCICKP